MYLDAAAEAHIRALFARRKREMPERNLVQAMFPCGCRVIPNPNGTAPGIDLDIERAGRTPARVFALPGVPAEMKEMWEQTVSPAISTMLGESRRVIRVYTINCFGVGESDLEAMLPDMIRRGRRPTVGITVSKATISLRIMAEGATEDECAEQIETTRQVIHEHLSDLIFGHGEDELQHSVVRLCAESGQTLAVAEIDSGGLLTHWLTEADPLRKVFYGGLIPRLRQVNTAQATIELAREAKETMRSEIGLALSEFPEPDSITGQAGEIHIALVTPDDAQTASFPFTGHPEILHPRAVKQALNFLRLYLSIPKS
jgi:nicotinamide-nucleotide amidase